jgi:hypothetical protein
MSCAGDDRQPGVGQGLVHVGGVLDPDEVAVADEDERRDCQLAKLVVGPPRQALVVGLALLVTSVRLSTPSLALYLIAGALIGAGGGAVFKGTTALVVGSSAPEDRLAKTSSLLITAFVGLSVPVIGAGVALAGGATAPDTVLGFATPSGSVSPLQGGRFSGATPGSQRCEDGAGCRARGRLSNSMRRIGFPSFGHWQRPQRSQTRTSESARKDLDG